jgi:hypothetical protein
MSIFLHFLTHEEQDTASHIDVNHTTGKRNVDGEKGEYMPCYTMKGVSGIAWFGLAIWELRGLRRGVERQDVPYTERKRITFIDL